MPALGGRVYAQFLVADPEDGIGGPAMAVHPAVSSREVQAVVFREHGNDAAEGVRKQPLDRRVGRRRGQAGHPVEALLVGRREKQAVAPGGGRGAGVSRLQLVGCDADGVIALAA